MWVDMNDPRSKLFGFHDIGKRDRVGLGHIATHNPDTVAIDQVLWKCCGAATTERSTQTGYSGAVSYTGLVLNRDNSKATAEELFHQIIFFNVQRCSTEGGDSQRMIDLAPIW